MTDSSSDKLQETNNPLRYQSNPDFIKPVFRNIKESSKLTCCCLTSKEDCLTVQVTILE